MDVEIARGLPGFLARPDGDGPFPGLIVIHEAFGLTDEIRRIARRFADAGYVSLAPDLLAHRGPMPLCIVRAMRDLRAGRGDAFEDLERSRAWLVARDDVDGSRIGVTGFCMGGGLALLYAVRAPVGAAAPFYGDVPKETERLRGVPPVVASFGARDRLFGPNAARLERHLTELGVQHDVKAYPDAGHSFMTRTGGWMGAVARHGPMYAEYNHGAAEDAWSRMLAFFAQHLG